MRVEQALVAIGGKARRLRAGGISVRVTKSFIEVHGRPLLYWNLRSMYAAGVKRLILSADRHEQLWEAELVLKDLDLPFEEVELFLDEGVGVHGLPHQVRALLDRSYFFECGHSLMTPEHYMKLDRAKQDDNVVFSAFRPHAANHRQPVLLTNGLVRPLERVTSRCSVLAHPILADLEYARQLPRYDFDITKIMPDLAARRRIGYVPSDMPPEFDVPEEYYNSLSRYADYLSEDAPVSLTRS